MARRVVVFYAGNPRENSYKRLLLRNYCLLATSLPLTVKAHVHSVTHCQLWKPQKAHFRMKWAFRVIQGHHYWCQQTSRTDCRHNVQHCPHYFRNLERYIIGKTANSSILTTPLQFEDSTLRNAFENLEMIYMTRNWSLTYISAADSTSLCLLLFTQIFLKIKRSESRSAGWKRILTWNSHSRSFQVIHFAINHRPTRMIACRQIQGHSRLCLTYVRIFEISEEVVTQIAKNCRRRQPHCHLMSPYISRN